MKLKDQVVSLGLAKQMNKLGFKQESLFYWWYYNNEREDGGFVGEGKGVDKWSLEIIEDDNETLLENDYPAYSVAELGKILPENMYSYFNGTHWYIGVGINIAGNKSTLLWAETEADARAKMLIYLKENNLI